MVASPRDDNRIPALIGVDNSLFKTPVTVAVDPITHAMLVEGTFTTSGTQNVNLTQVGGSTFALGQQLAIASLPVVLTASQLSTLTPLSTIAVTQSTSPWVVSNGGTFAVQATLAAETTKVIGTINQGTSPWVISTSTATGGAVPANAFYMAGRGFTGNLTAILAESSGDSQSSSGMLQSQMIVFNGSSNDRLKGDTTAGAYVQVKGGLMPSGTALNTFSLHSTSNTTTTPIASTAYISSIAVSNEVGGTTSTLTIQDKQGTPLKLVNGLATTALTTAPTIINFQTPVKMVGGIDIITAGAVAATVDIWINYYG